MFMQDEGSYFSAIVVSLLYEVPWKTFQTVQFQDKVQKF